MDEVSKWIALTGNAGFPIVISIYLLIKFGNKIDNMEITMHKLVEKLNRLEKKNNQFPTLILFVVT
ncbi:YvrJ family protein [Bacillus atrophaeus]|uniref:YvrJ family protein n=1 Tax=Bacillus atrophaeus TaxID=1452 RepID=UPI0022803218|nr:YvrJ family protein [Bacillus atrophaeus]MCY8497768.1 YvrJ family protein [Bacillus atrophaeus]MCY8814927.1 YvrJ family protein [Bacillus atrophaeus]MCY8821571.1 YvrJ family protein [Bacillus atrophaeus]MCY8831001.1 YvrJ family protein [Bacillus atrophaeus]MCY8835216.1 YvrJ family protein [Bacillus atrophaeus]